MTVKRSVHVLGRELLSVEDIATRFSYTAYWVRDLCRKGKMPATRIGRRWWINEQDAVTALGASQNDNELDGL